MSKPARKNNDPERRLRSDSPEPVAIGAEALEEKVAQIAGRLGLLIDLDLAVDGARLRLREGELLDASQAGFALAEAARSGVDDARLDAELRLAQQDMSSVAPRRGFPEDVLSKGFQIDHAEALERLVAFNQLPLPERRAVYDVFVRKTPLEELVVPNEDARFWPNRDSMKRSLMTGLVTLYGGRQ